MTSPLQGEDRRFDSAPAHHSRRKQKMLGQNFLIDDNIAKKIVNLADIGIDENSFQQSSLIKIGNVLLSKKNELSLNLNPKIYYDNLDLPPSTPII